jgi:nucleotide-binding universal stress UspA family protein
MPRATDCTLNASAQQPSPGPGDGVVTGKVVLVPLDGSNNALCALPIAKRLADLARGAVRILHVTDEIRPLGRTAESLGLRPADLRDATLQVCGGRPAEAILAAAAECEAALIVMCPYATNKPPAAAIGAVALAVLRGARCPVVLVDPMKASGDWSLRRVLAPHDGSPAVSEALRPAAELASEADAEFVVLQVAGARRALETGSMAPPQYLDQVQHEWPAWSDEFLQRLACVCPLAGARVRLLVGSGEPADETIRAAETESADLIVLAWKGDWKAPHASTLKGVLRGAPCPIMVTRVLAS